MTSNIDSMTVNAAIERLIARADEDSEAAGIVIAYGSRLKESKYFQIEHRSGIKHYCGEVSGYSPDQGEITIKDEGRKEQKERSLGIYKVRVGHFQLWKQCDGLLKFCHSGKSSITTKPIDGDGSEEYHLCYDVVSLEPEYLGVLRKRVIVTLWLLNTIEVSRLYLEQIYGKVPILRTIGISTY